MKKITTPLFAALLIFVIAKIYSYGAAPTKTKPCDFLYPNNVTDQTKPTHITITSATPQFKLKQTGGVANDASCLNKTPIYGVADITSINDVTNALQFARANNLKVTSAGQQHTMGGQSFVQNGLVLDLKSFKQMNLHKDQPILTVQSGATWAEVQQFLDTKGLAVKAMQSINIFTVGGSLSVNAHGITLNPSQIAPTVRSIKVMLSTGEIKTASPTENPKLFKSVLGGYGLFGVILEADLDVVNNEMYERTQTTVNYQDFPAYFAKNIAGNSQVDLFYGRLSLSPTSYLTEVMINQYTKTSFTEPIPALQLPVDTWLKRLVINFSKTGGFGRWVRWTLEKKIEPKTHLCSRNAVMSESEVCRVSRNQEMYDAMGYLKNNLKDTDILQEYFIPRNKMPEFVDSIRNIVSANQANLINVTIRIIDQDTITALPYAKADMFGLVLYFNQKLNAKDSQVLQKTTSELINEALKLGGTYYLPYQLYYSTDQLHQAYPEIDQFFNAKQKFDPEGLFSNTFYEKYGK